MNITFSSTKARRLGTINELFRARNNSDAENGVGMEADGASVVDGSFTEDVDPIGEWMRSIGFCSACWIDHRAAEFEQGLGLQAHHLVKRSRHRCDETWNLLCLCAKCHNLAEGHTIRECGLVLEPLTMPICLWLKRDTEPANYRPELMEPIYHRTLPKTEYPPVWLIRERQRRRPVMPWRELMRP